MTSRGTGSPNYFQCWKCRRAKGRHRYGSVAWHRVARRGFAQCVEILDQAPDRRAAGGVRHGATRYLYRCLDCGYEGTSRHDDLARVARRNTP